MHSGGRSPRGRLPYPAQEVAAGGLAVTCVCHLGYFSLPALLGWWERFHQQRVFHLDWPEGNKQRSLLLGWARWPGACCWDIVWAKDFYFGSFLGTFLSQPQI